MKEVLQRIGLTEGEIRVYKAVIKLGESSTGPIMQESNISSSKVYLILEKLIRKGFLAFVVKNNVKQFRATNPINIIEYIHEKEQELSSIKEDAKSLVKKLNKIIRSHIEESAKIYKGTKSMASAFQNILDELQDESFLFIGAPKEDMQALHLFIQNFHAKRVEKNIKTQGIVDVLAKTQYEKLFKGRKNIDIRYSNLSFPHAVAIGIKRVVISLWEPTPIGFEIESERMAKRYRAFFFELWER